MSLTVVVDGGGSGCRLGAFDASGKLLATATNGPASLTLGEEQAWTHICAGLATLAEQLDKPADWLPARLSMGLAGALQTARQQRFLSLLPPTIETTLVTDGHAQLLGACGAQPGICLAVGTGSVLHWLDQSHRFGMAGGWGFPAGDEASGAWLGAQLINAYLWHRDSQGTGKKIPRLFQTLEHRIGSEVSDVQLWSTNTCSTELASLAPMIVDAADSGDETARELLHQGVEQCERLLRLAPDALPIFIVGGLGDVYRQRLDPVFVDRCQQPHGDAFSGLYGLS